MRLDISASQLAVWADVDSGNPRKREHIVQSGVDVFTIYPECEGIITAGLTGSMAEPAGGSRCDVKIWNGFEKPTSVTIRIDRQVPNLVHHQSDYDYVYIKGEQNNDWQLRYATEVQYSTCVFQVQVQPGLTLLSQSPAYTFGDFQRFITSLRVADGVETRLAGLSEEGREIWWLRIADMATEGTSKYRILIVGRQHPYETASSYAIEAIARWLLSKDELARRILRKFEFHFVPMANPDGVYLGTEILTGWEGVNLTDSKTNPERDAAFRTLMSVVQHVRPHQYVEMHNWMKKDFDLLSVLSDPVSFGDRQQAIFRQTMPDQTQYGRKWEVHVHTDPKDTWSTSPAIELLRSRLFQAYDPQIVKSIHVPEFPWFGRNTVAAMAQTGLDMLKADVQVVLGLNDDSLDEPPVAAAIRDQASAAAAPQQPLVYVIQEQSLSFDVQLQPYLDQFVADLEADGYAVTVLDRMTPDVDPALIRAMLREGLGRGLVGAIMVGRIPSVSFKARMHWEHSDEKRFPTDLYYMDLDAGWNDTDGDGVFEEYNGKNSIDVWVGRLRTDTIGREAELLVNYFRKNHDYRHGLLALPRRALVYLDVASNDESHEPLNILYPNGKEVTLGPATSAGDYVQKLAAGHEWVFIHCHSDRHTHHFVDRHLPGPEIRQLDPKALFYHFSTCDAGNHEVWGYLAGSYVFAKTYGVCALASADLPAGHDYKAFYSSIARGKPIGEAFKAWFNENAHLSTQIRVSRQNQEPTKEWNRQSWYYGMTIIGDPTLTGHPRSERSES